MGRTKINWKVIKVTTASGIIRDLKRGLLLVAVYCDPQDKMVATDHRQVIAKKSLCELTLEIDRFIEDQENVILASVSSPFTDFNDDRLHFEDISTSSKK